MKSTLSSLLSRLHVLIVGPGLGREDYMINFAKLAVNIAKEQGMYLVLDADALWMIGHDLALVNGYRRAVPTPNVMEFKRLSENVVSSWPCISIAQRTDRHRIRKLIRRHHLKSVQ